MKMSFMENASLHVERREKGNREETGINVSSLVLGNVLKCACL